MEVNLTAASYPAQAPNRAGQDTESEVGIRCLGSKINAGTALGICSSFSAANSRWSWGRNAASTPAGCKVGGQKMDSVDELNFESGRKKSLMNVFMNRLRRVYRP